MKNGSVIIGTLIALLAANLPAQENKSTAPAIPVPAAVSFVETGQQFDPMIGCGVALGDFNGDGILDAFVLNRDDYRVYFGDGRGRFTDSGQRLPAPSHWWGKPAVGDINGDGRLEVITGKTVWLNDGHGQFTAHPELIEMSEDGSLSAVALADLNGDGHLDLFAIRNYAAMRVYLNDGKGHFHDSGQKLGDGIIGKGQIALIALGDINGDGSIDAVTAGWRWDGSTECPNHVWLNDGKGNFRDSGQLLDEGASHVHGLALGDLNGDGKSDLVMGIQGRDRSGRIYLNDGKGHFVGGANLDGAGGENVALGDFDGDGHLDVFVAGTRPPSRVWLNDGTGKMRDSGVRLGDHCIWDVAVGDLNGDGKPDVAGVGFVWGDNGLTAASPQVWLNTTIRTSKPSFAASLSSSHKASFQGLGDFPGGAFDSMAQRVSADGSVIVGYGTTVSGKQAFRWTQNEGMVNLGNLPDGSFKQSWAKGVSADGSVVVGYGDPDGSGWNGHKGFRWTQNGGMAEMGSLNGSTRYEVLDVSADGSVVVGDGGQQAFRWTQSGGTVGLGVLPGRTNSRAIAVSADGSVVVGSSYNLPSWDKQEAFIWTQAGGMQGLGYLPGGSTSFPNAISADGSVIAGTSDSSSGYAAFRWTRTTGMVNIGHLPGRQTTHPGAVSADGSIIVGASFVDRDHATAFIWDSTHGMRSLQSVLETDYGLNLTGWNLQNASDITPDGSVIVGWGTNPAGQLEAFRAMLAAPSANQDTTSNETVNKPMAQQSTGMQLEWTYFIGGSDRENLGWLYAPVWDGDGMLWFTGTTKSRDFPTTPDAFDSMYHGGEKWGTEDVFLVKFNTRQPGVAYSTILGGAKGPEHAADLHVDNAGNVYIVGNTGSSDFPTTSDAMIRQFQGPDFRHADGFLTILSDSGRKLKYSTFIGGPKEDGVEHVFVEPSGEIILFGRAGTLNFLPANIIRPKGPRQDSGAFVARLDAEGKHILSARIFYGLGEVDVQRFPSGDFLIAGHTTKPDMPTTAHAFDRTYRGGDIYIARLSADFKKVSFATFFGGSGDETGVPKIVTVDGGDFFVLGRTTSKDLPVTPDAIEKTMGGNGASFLARFSGDGKQLKYCTYLGGKSTDASSIGRSLIYDGHSKIYIAETTTSPNFPVTPDAFQPKHRGNHDIALLAFKVADNSLAYGSYLGGSKDIEWPGARLAFDRDGSLYVIGATNSDDFPTGEGTPSARKGADVFISKFAIGTAATK